MRRWLDRPIVLPDYAPEELQVASKRWKRLATKSLATQDKTDSECDTFEADSSNALPAIPRKPAVKETLDEAMARLYPKKDFYHVKVAHITSADQWHPSNPPTETYDPARRQPLDRKLRWEDHGLTQQTNGLVPHETVLDYLVDVMKNKYWQGELAFYKGKTTWPRTHYYHISRMIASDPFLLRLSFMLEGRFAEAAAKTMDYVAAVNVRGAMNKNARLAPHLIAAILVQALGTENKTPCVLCVADWNRDGDECSANEYEIRPFDLCVSLSSVSMPARFKACGNHYWRQSVTDCSSVDIDATLVPDECNSSFYDTYNSSAATDTIARSRITTELQT